MNPPAMCVPDGSGGDAFLPWFLLLRKKSMKAPQFPIQLDKGLTPRQARDILIAKFGERRGRGRSYNPVTGMAGLHTIVFPASEVRAIVHQGAVYSSRRLPQAEIRAAAKIATIPRWVESGAQAVRCRAKAVNKESGEAVSWGPGSCESAQHKASLWYSSGDYRSIQVERSADGGTTWKRI